MKLFLLSESIVNIRNEKGKKIARKIDEKNGFKENLKKSLSKCDNFVFICNNPKAHLANRRSAKFLFKGLKMAGFDFKKVSVLDGWSYKKAEKKIKEADLIFLQGGKLDCQIEFLKKINFKENFLKSRATFMGKSAGAMTMGEECYNYPEVASEIGQKRYLEGIGFHNFIIIPHFNLENGNAYCPENVNLLNEFFLPDSQDKTFIALVNGSYIFIDDDKATLYGLAYKIEKGQIQEICKDDKSICLKRTS